MPLGEFGSCHVMCTAFSVTSKLMGLKTLSALSAGRTKSHCLINHISSKTQVCVDKIEDEMYEYPVGILFFFSPSLSSAHTEKQTSL